MTAPVSEQPGAAPGRDPVMTLPAVAARERALADVRHLRALARTARSDGLPNAELRAAHATQAALSVLAHARRLSMLRPPPDEAVHPAELVDGFVG